MKAAIFLVIIGYSQSLIAQIREVDPWPLERIGDHPSLNYHYNENATERLRALGSLPDQLNEEQCEALLIVRHDPDSQVYVKAVDLRTNLCSNHQNVDRTSRSNDKSVWQRIREWFSSSSDENTNGRGSQE